MRDIGKNIKTFRVQKNLTQDDLAEKLFVTRQTVSNYEIGKSRPDVDMLVKIAEVLETDIHQLIYGPEIPESRKRAYLRLTVGLCVTVLLFAAFLILRPIALEWQSNYYLSGLNILLGVIALPVCCLALGWTVGQLLTMALNIKTARSRRVNGFRWVLPALLILWLVLSLWAILPILHSDYQALNTVGEYHSSIPRSALREWLLLALFRFADAMPVSMVLAGTILRLSGFPKDR